MKFNFEISHASAEEKRRIRRRRERTPKKVGEKREKKANRHSFRLIFHPPMPTDRPFLHTGPPSSFLENHQGFWDFGVGESRFNNRPPLDSCRRRPFSFLLFYSPLLPSPFQYAVKGGKGTDGKKLGI